MSVFREQLAAHRVEPGGRRWVFVPYDQLSLELGPLACEPRREVGVVLVENPGKARRRPYHKQKLALVLSNLRHFALEAAQAGIAVRHIVAQGSYHDALTRLGDELGPMRVMEPAERELRVELQPLVDAGRLELIEHEGWLTSSADFELSQRGRQRWRMEAFYRHVRRRTGILMEGDAFAGGRLSFDAENRRPWKGEPPLPTPPRFPVDAIKREVGELVERRFGDHPGRLSLEELPATRDDAETSWNWAKSQALPHFGPYEDAMSRHGRTLFHTRISALLNLHRLAPRRVIGEAVALDVPLASKEGFVRQILGWREFVRHVHRVTDGFRRLDGQEGLDAARPNALGAHEPLPEAYWGSPSGLACLDEVVRGVWDEGYGHHITRLMVLSNLATLLDVEPRQLADWFWVAYTDAYDWVVEPNVLGMGTFATSDLLTTKPYVSGAAYIDRMSDYCGACAFDPKRNCPITRLYWAFLARHAKVLERNPRLTMPYRSLAKRALQERDKDDETFQRTLEGLRRGRTLSPETFSASVVES